MKVFFDPGKALTPVMTPLLRTSWPMQAFRLAHLRIEIHPPFIRYSQSLLYCIFCFPLPISPWCREFILVEHDWGARESVPLGFLFRATYRNASFFSFPPDIDLPPTLISSRELCHWFSPGRSWTLRLFLSPDLPRKVFCPSRLSPLPRPSQLVPAYPLIWWS